MTRKSESNSSREVPHVFGEHRNLMGIMNPAGSASERRDTIVLMVTAGMVHQVGPFRLHVEAARALAEQNIASFRFDLSGIGESLAIGGTGTSLQRAAKEIGDAMDLLESRYGIKKFFLFGLCSGADDSFFTAQQDKRVCGAVLMDGCGYKTSRYTIHKLLGHYLRRSVSPQRWFDVVNRRIKKDAEPSMIPDGEDIREFPQQREAAVQIQSLVDRDMKLRFIYTGGVAEYYNYESQFWDMFSDVEFNQYVSTVFYPEMDHVAFLEEDRRTLIADVVKWADVNIDVNVDSSAEGTEVEAETTVSESPSPAGPFIVGPTAPDHPSPTAEY